MGLDTVELLMDVEKAFNIKIPDQEAEKILTVGDFHESVWRHLGGRETDKCHTQILFYKLRNNLSEEYGISKPTFKLDSNLDLIFPKHERRKNYMAFAEKYHLQLPSLVLPIGLNKILNSFGAITILGTLLVTTILTFFLSYSAWILLLIIVAILITTLFSSLLNP